MHFLFVDGDILETRPIAFPEVKKGDVIVFRHGGKVIVHRVLGVSADALETMGDNNARRDPWKLTAGDELSLVTFRVDAKKRRHVVVRGRRGMMRFYRNRLVRFLVRGAAFALRQLTRIADWREPLPPPEKFGDNYCYIVHNRTVAWRNGEKAALQFACWTDRLKYRSEKK